MELELGLMAAHRLNVFLISVLDTEWGACRIKLPPSECGWCVGGQIDTVVESWQVSRDYHRQKRCSTCEQAELVVAEGGVKLERRRAIVVDFARTSRIFHTWNRPGPHFMI